MKYIIKPTFNFIWAMFLTLTWMLIYTFWLPLWTVWNVQVPDRTFWYFWVDDDHCMGLAYSAYGQPEEFSVADDYFYSSIFHYIWGRQPLNP